MKQSLPTCRCGEAGVIFHVGQDGVYSEAVQAWVQRDVAIQAFCLTHAREAGWPWDVAVQLPLLEV